LYGKTKREVWGITDKTITTKSKEKKRFLFKVSDTQSKSPEVDAGLMHGMDIQYGFYIHQAPLCIEAGGEIRYGHFPILLMGHSDAMPTHGSGGPFHRPQIRASGTINWSQIWLKRPFLTSESIR